MSACCIVTVPGMHLLWSVTNNQSSPKRSTECLTQLLSEHCVQMLHSKFSTMTGKSDRPAKLTILCSHGPQRSQMFGNKVWRYSDISNRSGVTIQSMFVQRLRSVTIIGSEHPVPHSFFCICHSILRRVDHTLSALQWSL